MYDHPEPKILWPQARCPHCLGTGSAHGHYACRFCYPPACDKCHTEKT